MIIKLQRHSIKNKVVIICLISSMLAFFSAGVIFFLFSVRQSLSSLTEEIGSLIQIIGSNSTAALSFKDRKNGEELLMALQADSRVFEATIFDETGKVFVTFSRDGSPVTEHSSAADGVKYTSSFLHFRKAIILDGTTIGQLFLRISYEEVYEQVDFMLVGAAFAVPAVFFFIWFMATKLQNVISEPLQQLAGAMRTVQEKRNYSLRLPLEFSDEIGLLTKGFNEMIEEIEKRDLALQHSEEKYRYFFDNSEVGIFILAVPAWTFVTVNPSFTMMLDLPASDIIGRHFSDFLQDSANLHPIQELLNVEKIVKNMEICIQVSDGRIKTILATLKYDDTGTCIEGSVFDITDIKCLQKKLEDEQSRMIHAGRLASLGEMATGIAHEINQPLTIINLGIQYLEGTTFNASQDDIALQAIKKIKAQVERASTIIKNMRAFARGGSNTSREPTDVAVVVDTALTYFREQFRVNDIALTVSLGSDLPMTNIDPQKFEQVIVNLMSNARYAVQKKFEQTGGVEPMQITTTLSLAPGQQSLVFEVADNGIGMNETERLRCFEPFFTTKEVGEGTGIGLSISYNIIKEFGGSLEVESEKGKGTLFRILLPLERATLCV